MSLSLLATFLLCAAAAFILVAAVGDTLASRQMATERYRFVPLVRCLRLAQWPAVALGLAFVVTSLVASPLWSTVALLVAFLVAMLGQANALACLAVRDALLRGFMPAFIVGMLLVNFPGLWPEVFPHLELDRSAILAAGMLSVGYWYVAYQRTQQDLIRLYG